jgi:hypothetical protein
MMSNNLENKYWFWGKFKGGNENGREKSPGRAAA